MTPRLAITTGEPAGIGPDLCLQLAARDFDAELVLLGDPTLLRQRARQLGREAPAIPEYRPEQPARPGELRILPVPLRAPVEAGRLGCSNAAYVLETLDRAVDGCLAGEFHAMVTAPVHKGVINQAGIPFSGHTEYIQRRSASEQVVMMLATPGLRVALATTHLPLAQVAGAITRERLDRVLRCLHRELVQRFTIAQPRILVAGLNPHAGEGGHLGREEIEVIEPVVEALKREGMQLDGPLPADTLFTPPCLERADAVLAMYHDQGLPVLKHLGFGRAVNITLGLPLIRTSVDHGTALDRAGQGTASGDSLAAAIRMALELNPPT